MYLWWEREGTRTPNLRAAREQMRSRTRGAEGARRAPPLVLTEAKG